MGFAVCSPMPTQSFTFGRWLRRYDLSDEIEGPRFHRWLPNGEADALTLKTDDPAAVLRVWFKRQGRMDGAFFQFAHKEQSFDPTVVSRQGVLEAGPLYGQLDIDLSEEDIAGLRESSEHGQTVAKRILHLIHAPTSKLITTTLRTHYGQYWLEEWKPWDSRKNSLTGCIDCNVSDGATHRQGTGNESG